MGPAMTEPSDLAADLNARRGDRFAAVREAAEAHLASHACGALLPTLSEARYLAAIAAAARATYVLAFSSGLGYLALHLSEVFGHTGRLDLLENDASHASIVEAAARTHGLADRINVYRGRVADVVPSLNGPFDLILLDAKLAEVAPLYDTLVRLLRTGGSLVIANAEGVHGASTAEEPGRDEVRAREFLDRLAADEQVYAAFPAVPSPIIAVRRR